MLKADLQRKLERELGISLKDMVENLKGLIEGSITTTEVAPGSASNGESSSGAIRNGAADPGSMDDEGEDSDVDAEGIPEENVDGIDDLSEEDSGFGLEGQPVRFNSGKFWNYVDYMLNVLRETARKESSTKEEYEKGVANIMMQIFQGDLLDCPGSGRKGLRLTTVNPQWQTTIQHGLMW
ncbi:hypothetical protein JVT61DRAFT_14907 [Boletus reticuloceps]|uniref:Uncharacterized protein n=1 Tax=Boletus reticuloceps TaxID=495285 RepID=A0A8I3A2W4_9AGAM|nr:hypothetical protein JVT61DRAFT_14907 [Boletus reticuloceps]